MNRINHNTPFSQPNIRPSRSQLWESMLLIGLLLLGLAWFSGWLAIPWGDSYVPKQRLGTRENPAVAPAEGL